MIGKQGLKLQQTELNSLVQEVVALLKSELPGRRIEWKIHELPTEACDPHLMKQVFINLLINAAKYTRPRAEAVIEIGQKKINGEFPIYVSDNGVGFNMKYADKLFGVFQRLHSATDRRRPGHGGAHHPQTWRPRLGRGGRNERRDVLFYHRQTRPGGLGKSAG
jgi:light-regulated signal transduction histidine kinase (bacteriophytochrome)